MTSIEIGKRVLEQEASALHQLAQVIDQNFETAVIWILNCKGTVITCGIGKSGHIARKVSGTLSSTGTPSTFLHAAEAVHGDLGMVSSGDLVLLYTQSGETEEIIRLFPSLRSQGAKTVLITSRPESSAGQLADLILNLSVSEEACPYNLAPTTSAVAMLAISDALALAVMDNRGFTREDFAKFHPQGTLGRRLILTVGDAMRSIEDIAVCQLKTPVLEVSRLITKAGVGAACVIDDENHLLGFISDGDLRRFMASGGSLTVAAEAIMTKNVKTISPDLLAVEGFEYFQNLPQKLGELPVLKKDCLVGLLMVKDLLKSGIV